MISVAQTTRFTVTKYLVRGCSAARIRLVVANVLLGLSMMGVAAPAGTDRTMNTFTGKWKMRYNPAADGPKKQIITIEPVVERKRKLLRFHYDTQRPDGAPLSYHFTSAMDGSASPAMLDSTKGEIMRFTIQRIDERTFESTSTAPGAITKFRATVSPNGKVMTTKGVVQSGSDRVPVEAVFDRMDETR